ncbi:MAG: superoxide dismutase family protein [Luteolibacter sp.]
MKNKSIHTMAGVLGITALGVFPLVAQDTPEDKTDRKREMKREHHGMFKLIAVINPVGDSNVKGTVAFEKEGDGVRVTAKVGGLEPNTKHGIHVHEFGDLGSPDAESAGGHFNPDGHDHAMPDNDTRHAGDFGNLTADEEGVATLSLLVKNLKLGPGPQGILGRAVIVHENEDDGGQPTGNAGGRIGAGVIGISKDAMSKPDKNKADDNDDTNPVVTDPEVTDPVDNDLDGTEPETELDDTEMPEQDGMTEEEIE